MDGAGSRPLPDPAPSLLLQLPGAPSAQSLPECTLISALSPEGKPFDRGVAGSASTLV